MSNTSGCINFKGQSTIDPIKVTNARALTIALSDNIGEALKQGPLSYLEYFKKWIFSDKSCADKNKANVAAYNSIAHNDRTTVPKNQPLNDVIQATNGITTSKAINKFINFVKFRNSLGQNNEERLKFKAIIKENISLFGNKNYQIVFSVKDENQMEKQKNDNIKHWRNEEKAFDITADEALFLTDYVNDNGVILADVDPLQLSMQYMLYTKTPIDASKYNKSNINFSITSNLIKNSKDESSNLYIDENYIKELVNVIRDGAITKTDTMINVNYERDKDNSHVNIVTIKFPITDSNIIQVQYKEETLENIFKRSSLFATKINDKPINIKLQEGINKIKDNITEDKINSLTNDKGQNLFDNFEANINNYIIKNAGEYKEFLLKNNFKDELKFINQASHNDFFNQKLIFRQKSSTLDAQAIALQFFMNHNKNDIIKQMEKLGIPREILIAKLLEKLQIDTLDNKKVNLLNNYQDIVKKYAKSNMDNYREFVNTFKQENLLISSNYPQSEDDSSLQLAFYMYNRQSNDSINRINQFFNNLNINNLTLLRINSVNQLKHKESILNLLDSVLFANKIIENVDSNNIIKKFQINRFYSKDERNAMYIFTKEYPELNCYSIQNPENEIPLAYAMRDNSYYFNKFQIIDSNNPLEYLTGSDHSDYQKYKEQVENLPTIHKAYADEFIKANIEHDKAYRKQIKIQKERRDKLRDRLKNAIANEEKSTIILMHRQKLNAQTIINKQEISEIDLKYNILKNTTISAKHKNISEDEKKNAIRLVSLLNSFSIDRNPSRLTKRCNDSGISHAKLYLEKLADFYNYIEIDQNNIPEHPLHLANQNNDVYDDLIIKKSKEKMLQDYDKYEKDILNCINR